MEDLTEVANADDLARWLWLVDEKWTRLDEKLVQSKMPIEKKPKTISNPAPEKKAEEKTPVISEEMKPKTSAVISSESTHSPSLTNPLTSVAA